MQVDGSKGSWSSWLSLLTDFSFDRRTPYFNLLVPTAETTKYSFLLEKLMRSGAWRQHDTPSHSNRVNMLEEEVWLSGVPGCAGFNVLYMGETGVGKSVVVQSFLDQMTAGDQVSLLTSDSTGTVYQLDLFRPMRGLATELV